MKDRIIVSLEDARFAIDTPYFKDEVWAIKFHNLIDIQGVMGTKRWAHHKKFFADMKLFDTPNTMTQRIDALSRGGADMITVHLRNSLDSLKEAQLSADANGVDLIGITYLTSESATEKKIRKLARRAAFMNFKYIVCGIPDLGVINDEAPNVQTICPGIHFGEPQSGQVRTVDFKTAIESNADKLVLGRALWSQELAPVFLSKQVAGE